MTIFKTMMVIIAPRGDPKLVRMQIKHQRDNNNYGFGDKDEWIFVGPIWCSADIATTPKEHVKEHPDSAILDLLLILSKNGKRVRILPAQIDEMLIDNFQQHKHLVSGNRYQKAAFARTLKSNMGTIKSMIVDKIDSPIKIRRSSRHTPAVSELLALVPKEYWPTAFYINRKLVEPLYARAYLGNTGTEISGLLGTSLQHAIKKADGCALKMGQLFIEKGKKILKDYEDECSKVKKTCIALCPSGSEENCVFMPSQRMNYNAFKKNMFDRYHPDIQRRIERPIHRSDLDTVIDKIFDYK